MLALINSFVHTVRDSVTPLAVCADFKFRLSCGNQDFDLMNTKYNVNTKTWLEQDYMEHDHLPSFTEYYASLGQTELEIDPKTCRKLEKICDAIVHTIFSPKKEFMTIFSRLQLLYIEKHLNPIFDMYPDQFNIIGRFIFPTVRFWCSNDNMDRDEPLIKVEFSGVRTKPIHHFYIAGLFKVKRLLGIRFKDGCQNNPFGMGEDISFVISDCYDHKEYLSKQEKDILAKAMRLDMTTGSDEDTRDLYRLENEMMDAKCSMNSKRFLLFKSPHGVDRVYLPMKVAYRSRYFSVIQLYHELRRLFVGRVKYSPKSENVPSYEPGFLPQELGRSIASLITDEPYFALHLVCKSFYQTFKGVPRQPPQWPAFFVRSQLFGFVVAAVRSEVANAFPDYHEFPKRLLSSIQSELGRRFLGRLARRLKKIMERQEPHVRERLLKMQHALELEFNEIYS